ncbi:MAG: sigma-54 dependent transcriptional regulator, acetoin dehydrogenase operon transcriptional [Bacteroidales bacterium]|jgi:transcriptional regulator with PAS, ATPase and Fis domain|nr:sigma-54 dependent transcriptional regulator, acetoin dehydrogenase operon transcriptional [Bacteroidales bacterium]
MHGWEDDFLPQRAEVLKPGLEGLLNLLWQTQGSKPYGFMLISSDGSILSFHPKGGLEEAIGSLTVLGEETLHIEEWFPGYRAFMQARIKQQKIILPEKLPNTGEVIYSICDRLNTGLDQEAGYLLMFCPEEGEQEKFSGLFDIIRYFLERELVLYGRVETLSNANRFAYALVNNLAIGVLVINPLEQITWVNATGCRLLQTDYSSVVNLPISKIYADWERARRRILAGETFVDEEGNFLQFNLRDKFFFNAFVIRSQDERQLGYMVTFREFRRVINLVNKYTGSHARFSFDDIIALSPTMIELVEYAKKIADSPSSVLITGESGTGKEVFAQSIHQASSRKDAGFVAINCGAISPTLIESELFGYEEGAFTGARKGGRPGKFELADKGTLFLDEIGEMPPEMQVKLLRAIQEGRITRVGGQKEIPVDVRIIAATNRNPVEEIKKGKFRLDLYYRLNVIPLHIPPLRERKEDIKPLFRLFLKQKAEELNRRIPYISPILFEKIQNYYWPGNIRELENYAEQAVLLDGNIPEPGRGMQMPVSTTNIAPLPQKRDEDKILSLDEAEAEAIHKAVLKCNNNLSQAARVLKISRNTLYLKLRKYNIPY